MAPECLNGTINVGSIEELKKADVYAYGLVIWECLSRLFDIGRNEDVAKEYVVPYFEYVQGDPRLEKMKEVVCEQKLRPTAVVRIDRSISCDNVSFYSFCWDLEYILGYLSGLNI